MSAKHEPLTRYIKLFENNSSGEWILEREELTPEGNAPSMSQEMSQKIPQEIPLSAIGRMFAEVPVEVLPTEAQTHTHVKAGAEVHTHVEAGAGAGARTHAEARAKAETEAGARAGAEAGTGAKKSQRLPYLKYSANTSAFIDTFCSNYLDNNYHETLKAHGIENTSIAAIDVSEHDAPCIIAIITRAIKGNQLYEGLIKECLDSGLVSTWLKRLEALDKGSAQVLARTA